MALSDLLEDQVYEQLLVEYVTSLDEVWFEPKHETFERQLLNALNECRHTSKQVIDTQELGVALTARLVKKKQPS